jgi:WD40 repeat protein
MTMRDLPRGALAGALLLAAMGSFGGCGSKDSLIVVTVATADYNVTGLHTLVVTAGKTTHSFHIAQDLTVGLTTVGLYVPSGLTGSVTVTAEAVSQSGQCGPGYTGSTTVVIPAAGATVDGLITMNDATTCPPNGGTGGTSGTGGTGTGGTGGTGGTPPACTSSAPPPAGTPPQLACCAEYDQDATEVCGYSGTEVDAVAFSPDGATLVTAARVMGTSTASGEVKVWSFNGHVLTPVTTLNSDGWFGLAFSSDGSRLAVAVSTGVDIWNTSDWSYVMPLVGSSNFFVGVGYAPDQKHILAVDSTTGAGTLYVFDLTSASPGVPVTVVPLSGQPDSLAVAPKAVNGQVGVAVSYSNGTMDVLSLTNASLSTPTKVVVDAGGSAVWKAAFSPDGALVAISDTVSKIHTWAFPVPATLAESGTALTFSATDSTDIAYAVAFAPSGSYLAAGGGDALDYIYDAHVSIFTMATRSVKSTGTLSNNPTSVAFSPSGNAVAGGEIDCGRVFVCTN